MGTASDAKPVRLWSLYVPNGRELTHPHYMYKLDWLRVLRDDVAAWLEEEPTCRWRWWATGTWHREMRMCGT